MDVDSFKAALREFARKTSSTDMAKKSVDLADALDRTMLKEDVRKNFESISFGQGGKCPTCGN